MILTVGSKVRFRESQNPDWGDHSAAGIRGGVFVIVAFDEYDQDVRRQLVRIKCISKSRYGTDKRWLCWLERLEPLPSCQMENET